MSEKSKQILENLKALRQKEPESSMPVMPIYSNLGADRIYGGINGKIELVNQDGSTYRGKIDKKRITVKGIDGNNFFSYVYESADGRWFDRAGLPISKPSNLVKQSETEAVEDDN